MYHYTKTSALLLIIALGCVFGATCPAGGIECYPSDCCSQYRQCSGSTFYAAQNTPAGTVCKGGQIVWASDCTTPCSASSAPAATAAPATQRPGTAATTKPTSAPVTSAPKATSKPTSAPTQKATSAPTQKATAAPATSAPSTGNLCSVTAVNAEPIKILVPLYVYPGAAWDTVANAAKSTGVKTIAIINPNSGPDPNGPDSSYISYMSKLTAAGVDMVGYVHSTYAGRSSAEVYADIDTYANKYPGLKGIFIDEASALAKDIPYYTGVYNRIISKSGYTNAILNPGTQPDQGYVAISSNIVIFENAVSTLTSSYASWVKCAPTSAAKTGYKYKFSGIGYAASTSQISSVVSSMVNSGMGLVYVTDGAGGCCTYNNLATYYATMAAAVKAING